MHLKALTLRGFKSFASATTLRFEPGITCVVGPNGSGKSNVVDALSWVMGEQGAKSLRGGKMEDVIFAGTTGRPPLGRAEVSLTIDNSDGALPIEYAEVTITRIMFRNGGSEYQINGDTCRLLDIQELLSDSGIGREMHVIVGQGQLDSVLHADPMGRRAFIEEAAGVLKHRKRKEKALRKLDAMQANLARVQDLTDELRRQLKPLGRQAAVARRAAVIQADLRDARLRLLADDLVRLRQALQSEIADEAALKQRKESAEAELKKALQREALLEDEVRQLTPRLQRAQQTWYELSQLAERVRGTISLADARVKSATSAPAEERRGRDPEDMEREAARIREQEAELEAALEAAEHALEDTVAHRAELERELAVEERRLKDVARAIADRREGLARLNGQVNAARSRAASAQAEIDRLAVARDEAQERAFAAQEEYEQLKAEVDGLDAGDAELTERHEAAKRALSEAEAALSAAREAATAAERRRAATQARHEALALGLRRKDGTGALLGSRDRLTGLLGPAAELLSVTPGHEVALAAAFGAAADAIAVTTPASAAEAIRLLRKQDAGRAALLLAGAPEDAGAREAKGVDGTGQHRAAGDSASGAVPIGGHPDGRDASGGAGRSVASLDDVTPRAASGALPPNAASGDVAPRTAPTRPPYAADLVRGPAELMPAVRRLLRGIVVVGTLEDAEDLVYARPELTAVTAEGDLLGAHFAHGGSAGAPSLLEVQASVDEAAAELEELAVRCEELGAAQHRAAEERGERAALVEELGERRRAAEREKSSVAQQLGRLAGQARGAAGEAERSTAAAARAQEALDRAVEEAEELAERLAVAEEMPVEEEPDTAVRDRLAADGANARQTEMEARLQVRTHEERVKGLAGRADGLDRAARAEREARARAEQRRARLRHEAAVAEAVASGARQLLAHVEVSLRRAEEERTAADTAKARREQDLVAARNEGRDLKAELDKLTDSVHRGEVLGAEKRLRIEQLETKALEELGVEPAGLVADYGPGQLVPPSLPAEGEELPEDPEHPRNQPRPFHRAEQERRLKSAERAYAQLGKVNPLALEEFAALEERHKFLSEQLEDLKKTRADLLQVVKEVDERVEQVFTEAYRDTAREFEGVFSRLFPGGDGRLILTDPDNMLTTGVDVEARPPGKKVKRLSLLSGGERSLTAVALLVSIFKARPSPFYVMDEVEAALDDTNLQRLIRIMQELQEASQLIVITHQKRTMEVADALYGVSMQGDGVSKVISQRLR
ncbi:MULTISPECIES: AAA family ATPase [unclassified Streptomyces]|uniref:AAA family ATPase n=1 Tax=unclassified Streptomyces TaxID=2593676 RepID=UPI001164565B|nr:MULTISPECIES: AAA family ATPase [unclassified Streptomyces]NMI61294.1 AAA family ATPase [Streptomyces sp. RLA2-12]QDN60397.1 AAA family ATPase [Streptomyces sp. S1D4-20]QDN70453.1 AAA family ATPase [Streptomyces sp. S1D4-14]QDO52907.1 AAA family ATPase [Streptomyces sp. RLB3-5]QDO63150.1 AAA family ATPase [Streptomyces sp. RLB1-8]